MRVTFGIVNCNRLHYLKSCLESLLISTKDYPDKEIIVIDNASIEPGTDEYLEEIKDRGIIVFKTNRRDPSNEFARGLNKIVFESTGEIVCPLSGDLQFVIEGGWLSSCVELFKNNDDVGSVMLDAQRRLTIKRNSFEDACQYGKIKFWKNFSRPPIATSGNSLFKKTTLLKLGPWSENNKNHEGTDDSETKMLKRVVEYCQQNKIFWCQYQPCFPITVMINTDPRGTNARVRENKIYGKYEPAEGSPPLYYKMRSIQDLKEKYGLEERNFPLEIEEVAIGNNREIFLDSEGNWKKSPLRVENCEPEDWKYIDPALEIERQKEISKSKNNSYLEEWLNG